MTLHRVLLTIDLIAGAVALFFFLWGVADGSLYDDTGFALMMVAILWGIIGLGVVLHRQGRRHLSAVLLLVVAWPASMYGLFLAAAMLAPPGSWR